MTAETPYQRFVREQAERQAARAEREAKRRKEESAAARKARKIAREARRERAYHEALISDHNHEMDY